MSVTYIIAQPTTEQPFLATTDHDGPYTGEAPIIGLRTRVCLGLLRFGGLCSPFRHERNAGWCPKCGRPLETPLCSCAPHER